MIPGLCRCGHTKEAHTHYAGGKHCSACDCGRYVLPRAVDPVVLGSWIGAILVSATFLAIIFVGVVSLLRWLF